MNSYKQSQCQVKSGGFISNLKRVKEQIHFSYFQREFEKDEVKQVIEFCNIMADVLALPPQALIVIGKEQRYASDVQEVYELLDERHIETVLVNFNQVRYEIKSLKTYIRTALYNSYLEIENKSVNEANVRIVEND